MLRECIGTNADTHIASLQITSTLFGQGLPSPGTLLFKYAIRSIMLILNRLPTNSNNDDDHYETLVERQTKGDKNYDTFRNYISLQIGSTVVVHREDGDLWTHGTII